MVEFGCEYFNCLFDSGSVLNVSFTVYWFTIFDVYHKCISNTQKNFATILQFIFLFLQTMYNYTANVNINHCLL